MEAVNYKFMEASCTDFAEKLASKSPVPGGGGASAYVGSLAASLLLMYLNLSIGKKAFAKNEEELKQGRDDLEKISLNLRELVEKDALGFLPLSQAYKIKAESPEEKLKKEEIMESALKEACKAPMDIVRNCLKIVEWSEKLWDKGSRLALTDAASGLILAKSAMKTASLNVTINTAMLKDGSAKKAIEGEMKNMLDRGQEIHDEIIDKILKTINS